MMSPASGGGLTHFDYYCYFSLDARDGLSRKPGLSFLRNAEQRAKWVREVILSNDREYVSMLFDRGHKEQIQEWTLIVAKYAVCSEDTITTAMLEEMQREFPF